jgi:hypothetical protein
MLSAGLVIQQERISIHACGCCWWLGKLLTGGTRVDVASKHSCSGEEHSAAQYWHCANVAVMAAVTQKNGRSDPKNVFPSGG